MLQNLTKQEVNIKFAVIVTASGCIHLFVWIRALGEKGGLRAEGETGQLGEIPAVW